MVEDGEHHVMERSSPFTTLVRKIRMTGTLYNACMPENLRFYPMSMPCSNYPFEHYSAHFVFTIDPGKSLLSLSIMIHTEKLPEPSSSSPSASPTMRKPAT